MASKFSPSFFSQKWQFDSALHHWKVLYSGWPEFTILDEGLGASEDMKYKYFCFPYSYGYTYPEKLVPNTQCALSGSDHSFTKT